ncbi:Peptide chain release factor RF1 [Planctomycetes bacterium Pan216]|uniref:Peptide chain release factor 1 n=1 Tax=Kolteria novifilia TaxID=2527975 RepID=A0A518B7H6_9BACT|nr:Peptide chain release factor RF1 [Planctomycetes bacterium Pan216]
MSVWKKLDEKLERYEELERLMADPEVAGNAERYGEVAKEHGKLSPIAMRYRNYKQLQSELADAEEMLADPDMKEMAEEELSRLRPAHKELGDELTDMLLAGPESDHGSLIIEVRAGTGGDEATLFARDLYEMYRRHAETKGWKVDVLEFSTSDTRGFKEVIFSITGEGAYRAFRYEAGGHRVQRVPETEAQGRIHTSAATVAVLAEPEEVDVDMKPEDIEMEAIRSSGPGGQHVNKTSSAVRLRHVPSGLVVLCQDERSQHKNRSKAMRLLRSRLYDKIQMEQQSARDAARKGMVGSGDRSERIRTYNFPQNRCTDHRLGESFNLETIAAGNLDKLIKSLQAFARQQRLDDMADEM